MIEEDNLNLLDKTLEKEYLYFRLTRFLYQKCMRVNSSLNDFISVLAKLGKLAWETFKTGKPFLQRSQVIKEVVEDAFKYGLLIGHEDLRLVGRETTDILITFPHRTILDFSGSFYFVLMLDEGMKVHDRPSFLAFLSVVCIQQNVRISRTFTWRKSLKVMAVF